MKDFSRAVKEMNVPDIVQEKALNAFAQIQEESRMSKNSNIRRGFCKSQAVAAAAVVAAVRLPIISTDSISAANRALLST